jgi:uncharacterized protein (DUF952 family)
MRFLLHVARAEDSEAARITGEYPVPAGKDPFTHACFPEQLPGVLERFYAGAPREGLVLLEIDPAGLPVRLEGAADGAGEFLHVYGAISIASVAAARAVP